MAIDVKMLGRLARDPEQKTTPGGQNYVTFPFAVEVGAKDNTGAQKTLFVEVSAWGRQGETVATYCKKGTQLLITGNVFDCSAYMGKDNQPKGKLSVTLEKFEFVKADRANGGNRGNYSANKSQYQAKGKSNGNWPPPQQPQSPQAVGNTEIPF